MKPAFYSLSCECLSSDGRRAPYALEIEAPFQVSHEEWACVLRGTPANGPEFTVHGVSPEQAYALAFEFVHLALGHRGLKLQTADGAPQRLPRYLEHAGYAGGKAPG